MSKNGDDRYQSALEEHHRTLERQVADLTRELEQRDAELRARDEEMLQAQNQLIFHERMASLGTLSAGLAHELKNPLNFINNFSILQVSLLEEIREELLAGRGLLGPGERAAAMMDLLRDLESNAETIQRHGARAATIVQSMMELARRDTGARDTISVNALINYARVAYRGMQAANSALSVTIEEAPDPEAGAVTVVAQQLTKVIMHLTTNALESVWAKRACSGPEFVPTVRLWTRGAPSHVEIGVRDNGLGITPADREKIFTPFFTTKPAGRGNLGLGLSLSNEIINGHGGELAVNTREDEFTELVITLPRG